MTPVRLFLLVSFAFSWACFGTVWMLGGLGESASPYANILIAVAMLGPALGALVCTFRYTPAGQRANSLGLTVRSWKPLAVWIPAAWMLATLLAVLAVVFSLTVMGKPPADPAQSLAAIVERTGRPMVLPADKLLMVQIAIGLPVGFVINTVALTFSEELGWRGWLQPSLGPMGFWKMCFIIGVIWGLWHAPIILMGFNYPGLGWGGVLAMVAFCVLITPYIAFLRETGAGLWAAGAMHGAINAVTGATLLWMPANDWPHMGLLGLEGFALMLTGWAAVWLFRKRREQKSAATA